MPSVLIVDDRPENQYLLQALFSGHGYAVRAAENGAQALDMALQAPPDLIVSDVMMPVMDGFQLCRAWKGHPLLRDIPFVIYTGTYTDARDRRLAMSLGADAFIVKPAEPADFMAQIGAVLSRHRAGELRAAASEVTEEDYMRAYNATLLRKLEQKVAEQEEAHQRLHQSAAQLKEVSRRLVEAHERERRALARELHDEVGQVLTGLKLTLGAAAAGAPAALAATLIDAQAAISELMGRVRALSLDLRPALLDDMGLLPALGWYLERYTQRTGVRVALHHQGLGGRFPPEVETVAYRTIQEALTNVARHAETPAATVRLRADDARLLLRIDDAGRGFDYEAALTAQATSGLSGMRERVQLIGGVLTVESAPGEGTQIVVELPLTEEETAP